MLEIINQRYMDFLFEIAKKPRNISELAKKEGLQVSVASTLISRWAREGVVLKEKSGERGREVIITLTEYGETQIKLLRALHNNHKKNQKEEFGKKSLDEIKDVLKGKEIEEKTMKELREVFESPEIVKIVNSNDKVAKEGENDGSPK